MKIIKTQKELEALIIDDKIAIDDHLAINCNINLPGIDIYAWDINALNIDARDIWAWNIRAGVMKARDIKARNIDADIKARDIDASDSDIYARNIDARNIKANDISYYAFAIAEESFVCQSIKGRRQNSLHKCLDQEIQFINNLF